MKSKKAWALGFVAVIAMIFLWVMFQGLDYDLHNPAQFLQKFYEEHIESWFDQRAPDSPFRAEGVKTETRVFIILVGGIFLAVALLILIGAIREITSRINLACKGRQRR